MPTKNSGDLIQLLTNAEQQALNVYVEGQINAASEILITAFKQVVIPGFDFNNLSRDSYFKDFRDDLLNNAIFSSISDKTLQKLLKRVRDDIEGLYNIGQLEQSLLEGKRLEYMHYKSSVYKVDSLGRFYSHNYNWLLPAEDDELKRIINSAYQRVIQQFNLTREKTNVEFNVKRGYLEDNGKFKWHIDKIELSAAEKAQLDDLNQRFENRMLSDVSLVTNLSEEQVQPLKAYLRDEIGKIEEKINKPLYRAYRNVLSSYNDTLLDLKLEILTKINVFIPMPSSLSNDLNAHFLDWYREYLISKMGNEMTTAWRSLNRAIKNNNTTITHHYKQKLAAIDALAIDLGDTATDSQKLESSLNPKDKPLQLTHAQNALLTDLNEALTDLLNRVPIEKQMVEPLVNDLLSVIEAFRATVNVSAFKVAVENAFKQHKDRWDKFDSFSDQLYNALIYVFRAFFRVFDLLVTALNGAKQTKADTPGYNFFFNYVKNNVSKRVHDLTQTFQDGLKTLEFEAALSPSIV